MSNNRYDSRPDPTEGNAEEVAYDAIGGDGGESSSGYMDVPAGGRLPLRFVVHSPCRACPCLFLFFSFFLFFLFLFSFPFCFVLGEAARSGQA
jgi:hypothetical protein